ncbi:hypothetical protein EG329_005888 [Mollisiaceae sp. DMI_Dod_QoI]|nr:hypothetical protein EG329_005888 [Helotiales sp. DMI_Dod_QoI]
MSAEVVKKRGRPKKVITDPVEVELSDIKKKSTSRAKSTKVIPKATKPSTTSAKTTTAKDNASKSIGSPATPKATPPLPSEALKSAKPAASAQSNLRKSTPAPSAGKAQVSAIPERPASKILEQVRELSASSEASSRMTQPSTHPKTASKATPPATKSSSVPPPANTTTPKSVAQLETPVSKTPPSTKPAPSSPPQPKPTMKPHVPIAALNSEIVSKISTRAGARPNAAGSKQLPNNYKSTARKVTMTIVALPIAIVTSYVLYQRLVLGEEPKKLVPTLSKEPPKVETSNVDTPSVGTNSSQAS